MKVLSPSLKVQTSLGGKASLIGNHYLNENEVTRRGSGSLLHRIRGVTADQDKSPWLKNFIDAGIRSLGRQAEVSFSLINDNPIVRVPFRFVTEFIRNGTTASLQSIVHGKKVTREVKITVLRKTLENTAATAIFEPNKFSNGFARVGMGFLNMIIRFAARLALVGLNIISPEEIEIENLPDEFGSRSLGRFVKPLSDNPVIGLATRFAEQVVINLGLERLFLRSHILPVLQKNFKKPVKKAA